ncbi:hypothetical protein ACNQ17_00605 [Mycoplasma sp. Sp48II]|uniref:hypothetical protein n=1 Tax=Mycoplasma sp. Sp48II TaxID=3401682 RepID=UPI003AAF5103
MNLQEQFLHFTTKSAELYFTQYLTEIEQKIELETFQEQAQEALEEAISKDSSNWTLQSIQELFRNKLIKDYKATAKFYDEFNGELLTEEINDDNLWDFDFEGNDLIFNGRKCLCESIEDNIPTITNIADLFYELDIDFTIYVKPMRTDLKDNKKLLEDINDEMEDEDNEIVDAIAELKDRTKDITMLYWTAKDWYKEFYVLDLNNIK